jgi:hypothetical protein
MYRQGGVALSRAGPPEKESPALAANRAFRESKRSAGPYSAAELPANGNHLEPGTAIIPLTQGRLVFDVGEPFSDPHLESYLKFLGRDLSDEGVRAFLAARFTYERFRKVGTGEARRDAWLYVWLACRQAAKSGGYINPGHHQKTRSWGNVESRNRTV